MANGDLSSRDRRLGMGAPITRRDFIGSTLVGAGATLLSGCAPLAATPQAVQPRGLHPWDGYGGVGDYATSNGNTQAVMDAAHVLRDGGQAGALAAASPTGETFDLVVVGGGFGGLAAAFQFHAGIDGRTCLVLDNHPVFGGEAKENEFSVGGYRLFGPQGSNGFMPPVGRTTLSDDVWRAVGMPMEYEFADADETFDLRLAHDSYDAMFWGEPHLDVGHYFRDGNGGRWVKNIWEDGLARTPWSEPLRRDMLRAFTGKETAHAMEGLGPWLDAMSYRDYLVRELKLHPGVADHIDPVLAIANYGFGCDVISAYGAYLLQLPGMKGYFAADTYDFSQIKIMSFPGGNTTYARYIVKHLIPDSIPGRGLTNIAHGRIDFDALDRRGSPTRLRLGATAIDVRHEGDGVRVTYLRDGRAEQVRAHTVAIAASGQMARRIVADMPEPVRANYAQFHHGAVLVVNVALNNWRFLHRLGIGAGRWYDGFGFVGSIRAPMKVGGMTAPYHPDLPMVMTFYVPFYTPGLDIDAQARIARAELLAKPYLDYEREIRTHMNELFGSAGFDARRDIAGIILNRWGHAYIAPQPGFYFGGENGEGLTAPMKQGHGRIFYGHSELGWRMNYRNAITEGGRAGEQAAAALG